MIVKTPFYLTNEESISKLFTTDDLKRITEEQRFFIKHQDLAFHIEKKKIDKHFYLTKTRKVIHKVTREVGYLVEEVNTIKEIWDFEELPDFIYRPPFKDYEILDIFKSTQYKQSLEELASKAIISLSSEEKLSEDNGLHIDMYVKAMRPLNFLKDFNLIPPSANLLQCRAVEKKSRRKGLFCLFSDQQPPAKYPQEIPEEVKELILYKTLVEFFSKRPSWLKNVLLSQLQTMEIHCKITELKNVLLFVAYHYKDGPWKNSYIRFGYNPKSSRESVIYQTITLKVKQKELEDYENDQAVEQVYDPTFEVINTTRFIRSYQLCDLTDKRVREIVQTSLTIGRIECDVSYGWLTKDQHKRIFKYLKNKLKKNAHQQQQHYTSF